LESVIGAPEEGLVSYTDVDAHIEALKQSVLHNLHQEIVGALRAGVTTQEVRDELDDAIAEVARE